MRRYPVPTAQRGVALAVGLIFLVIITIMGLAAIRVTSSQTLQAANYQFKTVTFQGAESAIRRVMAEVRGEVAAPAGETNILVAAVNATDLAGRPTRSVDIVPPYLTAGAVTSVAFLTSDNPDGSGPPLENFSLKGDTTAYRFTIRATSTLRNTNAASDHQQGLARIAPRP
ncbi:PilX-like prepilin protein [Panacagrimonas perspica]|uniref:PilX-like prepilin protein n=1 Tax=Panacagrimonas perspica TaxID=381431 RepID=A0A4R7PB35_9GAMM|nr:PilX-like prepilin protein [Panacagrimonas perspica]